MLVADRVNADNLFFQKIFVVLGLYRNIKRTGVMLRKALPCQTASRKSGAWEPRSPSKTGLRLVFDVYAVQGPRLV